MTGRWLARAASLALMVASFLFAATGQDQLQLHPPHGAELVHLAWIDMIGGLSAFFAAGVLMAVSTNYPDAWRLPDDDDDRIRLTIDARVGCCLVVVWMALAALYTWFLLMGAAFSWGEDFIHLLSNALNAQVLWAFKPLIGLGFGLLAGWLLPHRINRARSARHLTR
jgi:hypothetical protein